MGFNMLVKRAEQPQGLNSCASAEGWSGSQCVKGYGTSKCAEWRPGKCAGPLSTASLGLPLWDLVFEERGSLGVRQWVRPFGWL